MADKHGVRFFFVHSKLSDSGWTSDALSVAFSGFYKGATLGTAFLEASGEPGSNPGPAAPRLKTLPAVLDTLPSILFFHWV